MAKWKKEQKEIGKWANGEKGKKGDESVDPPFPLVPKETLKSPRPVSFKRHLVFPIEFPRPGVQYSRVL